MAAEGEMLLLLLALLVSARCEVRARDPQVEGEEEQLEGGEVGGQVPPSTHRRDIHSVEEKGNHVIRRG